MKRLALLLLLAGPAYAQSPTELIPTDQVILSTGQSKVFELPRPFGPIHVPGGDTIAIARPQSDRQISITGTGLGETPIFVYGVDGKELWRATIIVGQETGHIVRSYDGRSKDYTGYYCTDLSCGRADKELNGARDVSSITTMTPSGVSITRTFGGK